MGSVKSVGGLTRGRGFNESTSLIWLLSMPTCAEVHKTMQDVTGVLTSTAVLQKDLALARLKQDAKDLQSVLDYLEERKLFSSESCHLRSLSSGFIDDGSVNVDSTRTIGTSIITSMEGLSIAKHKFTKSYK